MISLGCGKFSRAKKLLKTSDSIAGAGEKFALAKRFAGSVSDQLCSRKDELPTLTVSTESVPWNESDLATVLLSFLAFTAGFFPNHELSQVGVLEVSVTQDLPVVSQVAVDKFDDMAKCDRSISVPAGLA